MALAHPGRSDEPDILGPGQEVAGGQFVDEFSVDGFVEGKVEGIY